MTITVIPTADTDRAGRLAELLAATSPVARAQAGQAALLPVLPELAPLLPDGGLRRGTIAQCADIGMLLALAAGPSSHRPDSWTCAIGLPDVGWAAAAGYGLDLARVVLADTPGAEWAEVVSVMAGAVDVLLVDPGGPVDAATARRLEARLRQHGAVILTPAHWPGAQLRVTVEAQEWRGVGDGHGQLVERRVTVRTAGRGGGLGRSADLVLPNAAGGVTVPGGSELRLPAGGRRELAATAY